MHWQSRGFGPARAWEQKAELELYPSQQPLLNWPFQCLSGAGEGTFCYQGSSSQWHLGSQNNSEEFRPRAQGSELHRTNLHPLQPPVKPRCQTPSPSQQAEVPQSERTPQRERRLSMPSRGQWKSLSPNPCPSCSQVTGKAGPRLCCEKEPSFSSVSIISGLAASLRLVSKTGATCCSPNTSTPRP